MVVLNKRHLLHQNLYFGKKQAKGSKRKVVNMKGYGIIPFGSGSSGSGMYTLGTTGNGMSLQGSGMSLLGTGLLSKLKEFMKPLLKKGKTVAIQQAKNLLSQQVNRIKNPALKSLVQKGFDSGSDLLDSAMSGNKNLTKAAKNAALNLLTSPETMQLGMQGIKKLTGRGRPVMNAVASATDRDAKRNSERYTQDNRQLTLLKDVIKSKPITTKSDRTGGGMKGKGMYTL